MSKARKTRVLKQIPVSQIQPNKDNPRLVFRQEEMESLMVSIDNHGIQVPITVFSDGDGFTLLDGERRWRCAKKLSLKTIPALIQEKPTELENLVLMYNIHALREQWDYFTIASKLDDVMRLYEQEHSVVANEVILSELTGLTRGAIRRCQLLLNLPDRFKVMLRDELEKPKAQQRLSEDFFIEMERSLKTVTNRIPEFESELDNMRNGLITKFRDGRISAVTDFRQLSKIATAVQTLGVAEQKARRALRKVFNPDNKTNIRDAYRDTVEFGYVEKRAGQNVRSLLEFIENVEKEHLDGELDEPLIADLTSLHDLIGRILRLH